MGNTNHPRKYFRKAAIVTISITLKKLPTLLFSLIIILAIGAFFRFGTAYTYHVHELYHYVIGGKYFDFLGYRRIYAATALALDEQHLIDHDITVRNLDDKKTLNITTGGSLA